MPRPCPFGLPRLSRREWCLRLLLAAGACAIGYVSMMHTIAGAIERRMPEKAFMLAPGDGRIAAALSRKLFSPDADADQRMQAEAIARQALRQDPLAVEAIVTLGLNAGVRSRVSTARQMFRLSDRLSRRDLGTRLWLIEDSVARGDITGALHQYDIALRTSRSAGEILYPVLASALSDPQVGIALASVLAKRPIWTNDFITFAAWNKAADPAGTARLFGALHRSGVAIPDRARAIVVGRLLAAGLRDQAWAYYAAMTPKADRRRSRDPQFTRSLSQSSVFDWKPTQDDPSGLSVAIQPGASGGIVDYSARPGVGGVLLEQTQLLPPGNYILSGRGAGLDQARQSRPYWALLCSDRRSLGRVEMPNSSENGGTFSGRFTVPSDCPVQVLRLVALPSNELTGLSGQISRATLDPVG